MAGEAFIIGTTNDLDVIKEKNDVGQLVRIGIIPDRLADTIYDNIMRSQLSHYDFISVGYGAWMKGFTKHKLFDFFTDLFSANNHFNTFFSKDTSEIIKLIEQLDERKQYFLLAGEMYMVCPIVHGLLNESSNKLGNEKHIDNAEVQKKTVEKPIEQAVSEDMTKNRFIVHAGDFKLTNENGNVLTPEDMKKRIKAKQEQEELNPNDKVFIEITPPKMCCVFNYATVDEAWKNFNFEVVEDFGGEGEGYSWSDGSLKLCRCKNCGALFLNYKIRFLAMTYEQDEIIYSYFLPVVNRDEAIECMEKYIGSVGLKDSYNGKKIWFDGRKWCWNK